VLSEQFYAQEYGEKYHVPDAKPHYKLFKRHYRFLIWQFFIMWLIIELDKRFYNTLL